MVTTTVLLVVTMVKIFPNASETECSLAVCLSSQMAEIFQMAKCTVCYGPQKVDDNNGFYFQGHVMNEKTSPEQTKRV